MNDRWAWAPWSASTIQCTASGGIPRAQPAVQTACYEGFTSGCHLRFSAMELASHIMWRRCASHWRVCFTGGVVSKLFGAPPSGGVSRVTAVFCPVHYGPPQPVSQRASMALCGVPFRLLSVSPGSTLCWSCQATVSGPQLFCPSCSSIQPPDESKDHYQLLDCDRSFNIDVHELQRKYRNLQRLLHPDYFSQKSQREREISATQSSLVNKAYNTLLSPLSRGIYLLSLHGITIAEGTEGGVDAPFLVEILEINEKLNDIKNEAEMEEIGTFVQDKCQSLIENVSNAFEKGCTT
ncbi:iron-sulfur cluster co-chaperone protein HscB isoform X2 [Dendrobates tinctorius]|uniref:iron-sulfur cluster co-chaperone protein HscB isoform X2 n=1 Tax=Dendrobates tinctorius TaxID=92724 RepID=UPI003CC94EF7